MFVCKRFGAQIHIALVLGPLGLGVKRRGCEEPWLRSGMQGFVAIIGHTGLEFRVRGVVQPSYALNDADFLGVAHDFSTCVSAQAEFL